MFELLLIRWLKEKKEMKQWFNAGMSFQLIFKLKLVKYDPFRLCAGVISEMRTVFRSSFCIGKGVTMREEEEGTGRLQALEKLNKRP